MRGRALDPSTSSRLDSCFVCHWATTAGRAGTPMLRLTPFDIIASHERETKFFHFRILFCLLSTRLLFGSRTSSIPDEEAG
mgnify:CR=1 FL=1